MSDVVPPEQTPIVKTSSQIQKEILDRAVIIQSSISPITNPDDITTVILAHNIREKSITPTTLKGLLKRCKDEPTNEKIEELRDIALQRYGEIVIQEAEEKKQSEEQKQVEAQNAKTKIREHPCYLTHVSDGRYSIDFMEYTDFLKRKMHIRNYMKILFIYDDNSHTYKPHVNQIGTHTREIFKQYDTGEKLHEAMREILTHVNNMGHDNEYPFCGKYGTIHVLNGCLELSTGDLTDTTPDMLYDYRIGTEYKEFPDGTPELCGFLKLYGTNEPIDILAKTIWQRAYHDTLKEITIFYGKRDCGKTTLAELIQVTLEGDLKKNEIVSRTLLHDLLQRFGFANIQGKLLNIGDDLPDMFVKNAGRICELVGSINQHIEKKGIDGYDAIANPYYLFTTNNLPPLDDDDNAIWGKIHLILFDKEITDRKPRTELFTQKLREQLLYRAVEKALTYKKTPYVNNQTPDEVRRLWHESSTDIDEFIVEELDFNPAAETRLDKIKTHYESWCERKGRARHMKYLNKKLQPYFRKMNFGNVYAATIKEPEKESDKTKVTTKQQPVSTEQSS